MNNGTYAACVGLTYGVRTVLCEANQRRFQVLAMSSAPFVRRRQSPPSRRSSDRMSVNAGAGSLRPLTAKRSNPRHFLNYRASAIQPHYTAQCHPPHHRIREVRSSCPAPMIATCGPVRSELPAIVKGQDCKHRQ